MKLLKYSWLWIFLLAVGNIYSEAKKESLFIEDIQTIDVSESYKVKVKNAITINIINFFKNKYSVMDDEYIKKLMARLKINQQVGCSEDLCKQQLEDAINADLKIAGTLSTEGGKYVLNLKLYRFQKNKAALENSIEQKFTSNQWDYYLQESTKAILDSSYKVNEKDAPLDVDANKIDISKISVKEVTGIDLKIMDFKSEDNKANNVINTLKDLLNKGDQKFKNKEYEEAIKKYENILQTIISDILPESRAKVKKYEDAIIKRLENSYSNLYSTKIKEVDTDLPKKDLSLEQLTEFLAKYEMIQNEYNNLPYKKSPEITNGLIDRIEKLDLAKFGHQEKAGDNYYESYNFSSAITEYQAILKTLKARPKRAAYTGYLIKLEKKINATQKTGESFVDNKINIYCDTAETKNVEYGSATRDGDLEKANKAESVIRTTLEDARNLLLQSQFAKKPQFKKYDATVKLVNKDGRQFAKPISDGESISDIKKGEKNRSQVEIGRTAKILDYFLPGAGLIYYGESNGYYIAGAFLASLALSYSSYQNYNSIKAQYNQTDNFYALIALSNPSQSYALMSLTQLEPIRVRAKEEIANLNFFSFLTAGIYVYNLMSAKPYDSISNTQSGLNFHLKNEYNYGYGSKTELGKIYTISYTLHFNF